VVTDPHVRVHPEGDRIQVSGAAITRARWTFVVLNKPRNVVTSRSDPEGRSTVYDLLADLEPRVVPVGRLDYASSGLLLFTNDTQFANWLTDPRSGIVRRYVVTVRGSLSDNTGRRLEIGLADRREQLGARSVQVLKRSARETHAIVELTEGKNREIRRMMTAVGHEVTRLKRIAFGGLELGDLPTGKWREIPISTARHAFPDAPINHRLRIVN
jgi:23S rRNA pseudouridine2605 synthase